MLRGISIAFCLTLLLEVAFNPAMAQPTLSAPPFVLAYLGNSSAVNAVAFAPDGRQALSGGHDNVLRLWDAPTGLLLRTFDAQTESINTVTFSPDGRLILSGGDDKKLRLWDMTTGRLLQVMEAGAGEVWSAAFSPDGLQALSGGKDKIIRLWDVATGGLVASFEGHADDVLSVAFSPDGQRALSGGKDHTLKFWDVKTGRLLRTFEGHGDAVTSVALSRDGRQALSGSKDKTLKLWDTESGLLLKTFAGHAQEVLSISLSADGRTAVSAGKDNCLKLWDVASGQTVKTLSGHADIVTSAAFSPDGHRILSGSWDKTIKIWDAGTAQPVSAIDLKLTMDLQSTTFSPNGHHGLYDGKAPVAVDTSRLDERLREKGLKVGAPVFLRVFKADLQAELWMKRGDQFVLFATYPICAWSGQLGPKLFEGDHQAPEGFYTLTNEQLNPNSRYHRAFNLGYPNLLDRTHQRTGASLMMHGGCASVGCYAMTDAVIDELWRLVTSALAGGENGQQSSTGRQERVSVHVFPFRMTDARLTAFAWHPWAEFWRDMKPAYDLFEAKHVPPQIAVCNGRYMVRSGQAASSAPALQQDCFTHAASWR